MKTILLIDDDEICRKPAAEALRRANWKVIEAADGDRGIELAIEHRPDVILCDLLMHTGATAFTSAALSGRAEGTSSTPGSS